MIRIESTSKDKMTKRLNLVKVLPVISMILCFSVNFVYAICRYLFFREILGIERSTLEKMRIWVFCLMILFIVITFILLKSFRLVDKTKIQSKPPEQLRMTLLRWRLFEVFVISYLCVVLVLYAMKTNGFYPYFDLQDYQNQISATQTGPMIDFLLDTLLLILFFYLSIKIPLVVGNIIGSFNRAYIGKWHFHESVFGIAWFLLGCALVLFGEFNDRVMGILYILPGVFLIGRDYDDVKQFKFIESTEISYDGT